VVRIPLHEKIKVVNVNRMQVGQVQLGTSKWLILVCSLYTYLLVPCQFPQPAQCDVSGHATIAALPVWLSTGMKRKLLFISGL
jgi:hypothetical protein